MKNTVKLIFLLSLITQTSKLTAQYNANNRFEQMSNLPTPNTYRTASGSPGKEYWQQRADYDIKAELDDVERKITGSETITYFNNSPDELPYLWLQLDQNIFQKDAIGANTKTRGLGIFLRIKAN